MFFVAVHKWNLDDYLNVAKKIFMALANLPEGVSLCSSYVSNDAAWCVYTSDSIAKGKQIQTYMTEKVPEMKTEVTPVLQFFPPSPDIYMLIQNLLDLTSQ